jgi:hypothetical protein
MNTTPDTIAIQVKNLTKYFNDLRAESIEIGAWGRKQIKLSD